MKYPIFNSIVNRIESELIKRNINVSSFKTWDENRINASGLEIVIDLSGTSDYIRSLVINFDWDKFREIALARQLDGMEEHPLLAAKPMISTSIEPLIDIEVVWQFDPRKAQEMVPDKTGTNRLHAASEWMESINKEVNQLLASDNIITRWHIEVEGDQYGRYLSTITLLSYFQYSLSNLESLNETHRYVARKIQHLLYKTNKVIELADRVLDQANAA